MIAVLIDLMALRPFETSHYFKHFDQLLASHLDHSRLTCVYCALYLIEPICVRLTESHLLLEFILAERQRLTVCRELLQVTLQVVEYQMTFLK